MGDDLFINGQVEESENGTVKFFRENPYFVVPWLILALVQGLLFNFVPPVVEYCKHRGLEMLGFVPAIKMAAFAICAQYAVHGFITCHADALDERGLKLQDKPYPFQVEECARRSNLIIIVSMTAYALTPMPAGAATLLEIYIGYCILNVLHDAWFYCVHRAAHTKSLYALIHKTHHLYKQPQAFSAYYIRSPSQILQEHACLIPIMLFLPVPMTSFLLYQYLGAPLSMIEHSGYNMGDLPLPLVGGIHVPLLGKPCLGHVCTILGGGLSLILGSQTIEMHDYHHEKFFGNYGLSYSYLDKLLGTYKETQGPQGGKRFGKLEPAFSARKLETAFSAPIKPTTKLVVVKETLSRIGGLYLPWEDAGIPVESSEPLLKV